MYVRRPDPSRPLRVPENYSGNAFSGKERYHDMPPPVRRTPPKAEEPPNDLSRQAPTPREIPSEEPYAPFSIDGQFAEEDATEDLPPRDRAEEPPQDGDRPPLLTLPAAVGSHSSRFPFGHGIGSEELLILAMMLLVFLSGSEEEGGDHDLLLLLGLLLFAG